jgi:2'-5' RNA ligase
LAHATEAAVCALGVEKENREYLPHLTLARIRERAPLDKLRREIEALPPADFGWFRADAFHLYESAAGTYTRLAAFPLT